MSFSAEPLPEPYREITDKVFKKKDALLQYSPGKCIFSPALKNIEQDILDCQVREDDVWFISYPRTGKCNFKLSTILPFCIDNLISANVTVPKAATSIEICVVVNVGTNISSCPD